MGKLGLLHRTGEPVNEPETAAVCAQLTRYGRFCVVIGTVHHAQGRGIPAPMRGRDAEQGLIRHLLERARQGKGSVLLVEGEPGAGKTSLLAAAGETARAGGFTVAAYTANEGPPAATPAGGLLDRLKELPSTGLALIGIDDVQWADPATLRALRSLPGLLAGYPLAWILARGTHGGDPEAETLFDVVEHTGGTRTRLAPLTGEAQAAVMRDLLGGIPDEDLADSAACAAGNPLMLTEFLRGLVDEDAISLAAGRARLMSPKVPERFLTVVRNRLGILAARTKYLLEAGSVLGRSFRLEDAAELLDQLPGSLLAEVDEALSARIVLADGDSIAFRHDLVWRAVEDSLPLPVAQALHHQAGQMLLARGGDAVAAARHLLAGAHPAWTPASADILRARAALARGRVDDAVAKAELALGHASVTGALLHDQLARCVLATIALRRGGLSIADGLIGSPQEAPRHFLAAYEGTRSLVVGARIEEARNGPRAALDRLGGLYTDLLEHRYPLVSDPACAAWLVRVALAAGDRERASLVVGVMADIDRANPGVRLLRACADHAAGIFGADRLRLERAVSLHDDPWTRASAAEDLGALAVDSHPKDSVRWLDMALDAYLASGAERDAARVRHQLRRLGVRRRHWRTVKRPETGWESLTKTESSVAGLVATGLTNQQVADQMFISTHTVAFHLRQVFRKLDIRSRVELARAALERPGQPGGRRQG